MTLWILIAVSLSLNVECNLSIWGDGMEEARKWEGKALYRR